MVKDLGFLFRASISIKIMTFAHYKILNCKWNRNLSKIVQKHKMKSIFARFQDFLSFFPQWMDLKDLKKDGKNKMSHWLTEINFFAILYPLIRQRKKRIEICGIWNFCGCDCLCQMLTFIISLKKDTEGCFKFSVFVTEVFHA